MSLRRDFKKMLQDRMSAEAVCWQAEYDGILLRIKRLSQKGEPTAKAEIAMAEAELMEHVKKQPPDICIDQTVDDSIDQWIPGYSDRYPRQG